MNRAWFYIYYPFMEVKRKFLSMKYLTALILIVFINILYTVSLRRFSSFTGYGVTPWLFPFLISVGFYSLIYFALFVYFYSDAPFIQTNTMYQMIRCGRVKWGVLQIEKIILSSFVFNLISFLISAAVLLPYVSLESGWGKVIYTLARTDAGRNYSISMSFPYDFIRSHTPVQLLMMTMVILWLAGSFIGLMMFAVNLWAGHIVSVICSSIAVVSPLIMDNFVSVWRPLAMHFSPLSWTRITEIGQYKFGIPRLPSLMYIITMYVILCVIFGMAAIIKLKNVDLKWSSEE